MAITTEQDSDLVSWLAASLGRGDLAPLSCADLEELAGHMAETRFAGGMRVYKRYQLPDRVHILRSGTVELARELGGRRVVVQLLRPGAVFGDIPLFLRTGEPTEARATEDSTVLSIDSLTLFTLLGQRPNLARRWLVSVAGRMAEMQDRVSDLLAGSLDQQVASWLVREAGPDGVTVSQQTLARLLGARRTSVNQSLRRLESQGLIETGYRRVTVIDSPGLKKLLGTD
ncbi:MAG: Crp/Fnr family transcriptional regulator [Acidimicrobiales bacterium]